MLLFNAMRLSNVSSVCLLSFASCGALFAQFPDNLMLAQEPTKVSDHVYMLKGFPNVGIVVGDKATLVVDTGLGPKNGEFVARAVKKLAKGSILYLTTTHFHPEHAGGDGGFPESTIIIRNLAQQIEADQRAAGMIEMFAKRPEMKELLAGVTLRPPDMVFDHQLTLDLGGGVLTKLFWMGAAHTAGDEMVFVDPDATLISGDVVQYKQAAAAAADGGSVKNWIFILDQLGGLHAKTILPDHSDPGPADQMIQLQRIFLADLQTWTIEMKHNGVSADDAAKKVTEQLKVAYPDWEPWFGVPASVKTAYRESD